MNKVCIIDNYDSFTYNIVDLLYKCNVKPVVVKNDDKRNLSNFDKFIISPGPSHPVNSGISLEVIKRCSFQKNILGICLGHQAIGEVFGCRIDYAKEVMHGKISLIYHNKKGIFKGIPSPFKAVRYHSLIIKKDEYFNENLEITAWTEKNGKFDEIMGIKHKKHNLYGIQFHPESFLSEFGKNIMDNFINL